MTIKPKIVYLILAIGLAYLTSHRLWRPGYFSMQDDVQIFRLQQFDQCIKDKQIPCRYIPNGGLGYGYPLFNYYSPLPYAVGEIFHLLGFSLINSIKIVFILIFFIASVGMYLLSSYLFGSLPGSISTILFVFAPYQAVDSFVRGALAEFMALSLIPWLFYTNLKYINKPNKKWLFFSILSTSFLLLTHNLYSFVALPFLTLFLFINSKNNLKIAAKPFIFSLGLSSFFLVPAIAEKNLVTVDTMTQGYFNFVNHFVDLKQLFISRFWGYGASLWGPVDDMSFQIGLIQWLIPLITFIMFFIKKVKKNQKTLLFFLFSALFFMFLTHSKSTFIWQTFPFMAYFQFPWRFLGFAIFCLSLISGFILSTTTNKSHHTLIVSTIVISAIALNFNYFREDIWFPDLTDAEKLSSANLIAQSGAGLKDYWPKYGQFAPTNFSHNQIKSDQTIIVDQQNKTSNRFSASVTTDQNSTVTLPLVYFPNWQLTINQQPSNFEIEPELGLIELELPPGQHQIDLTFTNTPIRTMANLISLVSLLTLCLSFLFF